jgi:hypothetical protein
VAEADLIEIEDGLVAFEFDDVHTFRWDVVGLEYGENDSDGVVVLLDFFKLFDAVNFFVV